MHVRTQIRTAVRDRLAASVASVSGRVFAGRVDAFSYDELPAIAVDVASTRVAAPSSATGGPALERRDIEVAITILDALDGDVSTALDDIAVEVEAAMVEPLPVKLVSMSLTGDALAVHPSTTEGGVLAGLTIKYSAQVATMAGEPGDPFIRG